MTFFLYETCAADADEATRKGARLCLDSAPHPEWTVIKEIEADTWLDARDQVPA